MFLCAFRFITLYF